MIIKFANYLEIKYAQNINSDLSNYSAEKRMELAIHAINPDTPADILNELAKDPDVKLRMFVACHPNTSADTLGALISDKDSMIRSIVAVNPNTPTIVLNELAKDPDVVIRDLARKKLKLRSI